MQRLDFCVTSAVTRRCFYSFCLLILSAFLVMVPVETTNSISCVFVVRTGQQVFCQKRKPPCTPSDSVPHQEVLSFWHNTLQTLQTNAVWSTSVFFYTNYIHATEQFSSLERICYRLLPCLFGVRHILTENSTIKILILFWAVELHKKQ